uniref:Uncharacterized protein n=1 Tax=Anguilla anguilla TaxID=7936 RepID=A0A0E9QN00_ANGAN
MLLPDSSAPRSYFKPSQVSPKSLLC